MVGALDGVAPGIAGPAGDTLGGTVGVADRLPVDVLDSATRAFTDGLGAAATAGAVLLLVTAAVTAVALRQMPAAATASEESTGPRELPEPVSTPIPGAA